MRVHRQWSGLRRVIVLVFCVKVGLLQVSVLSSLFCDYNGSYYQEVTGRIAVHGSYCMWMI